MSCIDDLNKLYNSADAVSKRKAFEMETERRKMEGEQRKLKERDDVMPFVNNIIADCKKAAGNGVSSISMGYLSTIVEEILREKGFKVSTWNRGQCTGGTNISGWGK